MTRNATRRRRRQTKPFWERLLEGELELIADIRAALRQAVRS